MTLSGQSRRQGSQRRFTGALVLSALALACETAAPGTGDSSAPGAESTGGTSDAGGSSAGGAASAGGASAGGASEPGGSSPGGLQGVGGDVAAGGASGDAGGAVSAGGAPSGSGGAPGVCSPSSPVQSSASGSGPHKVIVETNSDPGIAEGTIFRPAELDGEEKFPIFVWGQGGCSQNGLSNADAMAEIASHGYFVIADGTPGGEGGRMMDRSKLAEMGAPLLAYVDWAIAENHKPCSAYYQSLDTEKVASNGFSCGGLMAQGTVTDPRIVTWGVTSSGMAGATQDFYDLIKTPVLFVEGGEEDIAYQGALQGYEATVKTGVTVLWFSVDRGHGGDLFQKGGGDFTKINLAWLNWWLKGDESMSGKGLLVGPSCPYCSDAAWDVRSANLP